MIDTILLAVLVVLVAFDLLMFWNDGHVRQAQCSLAWQQRQRQQQALEKLLTVLNQILGKEGEILAEIDDLKQAVSDLQTAAAAEITALGNVAAQLKALSGQSTINPADVEAAAQSIEAIVTNLNAATASVAAPAPATPAPATPAAPAASGS